MPCGPHADTVLSLQLTPEGGHIAISTKFTRISSTGPTRRLTAPRRRERSSRTLSTLTKCIMFHGVMMNPQQSTVQPNVSPALAQHKVRLLIAAKQPRSFSDARANTTNDSRKDNGFGSMFGSSTSTWGAGNIWSSSNGGSSFTNGFGTKDTTRNNSRSGERHAGSGTQVTSSEPIPGSGSLLQGSTALGGSWRDGSNRRNDSHRSLSTTAYGGQAATQHRSFSNVGIQQTRAGASQGYTSRAPATDLTTSAQSRQSFGSAYSGFGGRTLDNPPTVYTKLDRNSESKIDSASGVSPTQPFNPWSEPGSRDISQPPSRHSNQQPPWPTDFGRAGQVSGLSKSREPSLSQRSRYDSYDTTDQLASQLSQMRFGNQEARTTHKPTISASAFVPYSTQVTAPLSSRSGANGTLTPFEPQDELEEVDRYTFPDMGISNIVSPQRSSGFQGYSSASNGLRYMQSPTAMEPRGTSNTAPSNAASRSYELPTGPRTPTEWQTYVNGGATQVNRSSPTSTDQQAHIDPRVQQFLAAQLRNSYAPLYSPYVLSNGMQLSGVSPYLPLLPMAVNGVDPHAASRDAPSGDSVQSALMYEFKSNTKTRRYELKDIYDHIAEFSGDQHGSRFIQTKLETANSDEKDRVFREIQPNAIQLMTDVFGNYVIQKFFEHGDQTHKKILANTMRGQVLSLSLQMYGCRVVQKALDHVLVDQQAMLISELENHVLKCVKDQNGNHVIQKAIERCPSHTIGFIIDAFRGQVQHLSIHPYGCRVIQRCLERCDTPSKAMIMSELMDGIQGMISDQYGNYVVQHVVSKDDGLARQRVLQIVLRGLEGYSKHKFASNVVEKCLEQADDTWRRQVVYTLADCNQRRVEGDGVMASMIKDNFGNYVIRKLRLQCQPCSGLTDSTEKILDTLCPEYFAFFVDMLQPAVNQAKRTGCGKQLMSVEKKMHRLPPRWNGPGGNGGYGHNPYQLPLPTPPFTSHYTSAATTPPPLTADSASRQSSTIPSINGDAVEGADASRKGSDPSADGKCNGATI